MQRIVLFLIVSAASLSTLYAQCDDFHLSRNCRPSPHEAKDMNLSGQSRSTLLEARNTYDLEMMLFGRMDYKMFFCTQRKFYPIHFIITDIESGEVLFDNSTDDYVEALGFSTDKTTRINVQVTLIAEDAEFRDIRENLGCIGITVLFRRTPRLGF